MDPENLEYLLRVHGGFSMREIMKMTVIKAIRFGRRILFDLYINRPDTYLVPLMEAIPEIIAETQAQINQTTYSYQKGTRQSFKFPQTWV